jgi:Tol biopolymer transport system component
MFFFSRLSALMRLVLPFACGAALLAMMGAAPASAVTFNRNAAQIRWRTAETEHFRFHYPKELEETAGYIAGIAEGVAADKLKRYNITLPNKVEFIVRDDIFSNGWANSLQNTMTVWATDWDFPVRSTHNWLKDVVTHEFAHLVSIQSGSKVPSYIQGMLIGYADYYNEPVQGNLATLIPFTDQPNWFAEGVAQYESEKSGFDAWDSHRDMLLRVATMERKLLSIERMGSFAGTALEYELGPYTQGFALTRFIAARYGDDAMLKLWAENARIHRQTMSGSMERVLGKSDREVYEEWKNEMTAQYAEQVRGLGRQVTGKKLTSKGFYNYYPRWDSKDSGIFYVSNAGRNDFRSVLGHVDLKDTAKKEEERFSPIPGVRSFFDVAKNDSTFLYASAKNTDEDGVRKLDVYQKNLRREAPFFERRDTTEKRFTENLNAANATYSPDGTRIVFVRGGLSNFRLCVAPVPEGKELDEEEVRTIFPTEKMLEGRFGYSLFTPRFSPDGKKILFSYFDENTRNIGLINADGSGFVPLLARPFDERDPDWAPDGKSFYFSSDSTGIYNIYRYTFAGASIEAVTNVAGGAFSPAISPKGDKLAYVNYDKDGFSLYLIEGLGAAGNVVTPSPAARAIRSDSPAPDPIEFAGNSDPYTPVPTRGVLTPILFGQETLTSTRNRDEIPRNGIPKWLVGASGYLADPVLKNEISGAVLAEVGNGFDYFGSHSALISPDKESQFFLSLSNHSTPVTLGVSFFRGNLNTYDTVTNQDVVLDDGVTVGDKIERQDYALTFRGVEASAAYDLFDAQAVGDADKTSYVRLATGYGWNDFNFYDLDGSGQGFAFTYYKSLYLNALVSLYGADYNDKGLIAPSGLAAALSYTVNRSDLVRSGTFQETFVFENGKLTPLYRRYIFQDMNAGATYGIPMPWSKNSSLVASAFAASLLDWKLKTPGQADTLDSFFEKGLLLRGYPYLRTVEDLAFSGENTLTLSADLNQPLLPDIYRRFWIVFVEDLYVSAFWEAGRAWNGSLWDTDLFSPEAWKVGKTVADPAAPEQPEGWYQSVGLGLKVNARVYHNYPFMIYVEAARALSPILDGQGTLQPLETVRIDIGKTSLDTYATRISFGVTFGLYNGLLGRQARNPLNPRSPFAVAR